MLKNSEFFHPHLFLSTLLCFDLKFCRCGRSLTKLIFWRLLANNLCRFICDSQLSTQKLVLKQGTRTPHQGNFCLLI